MKKLRQIISLLLSVLMITALFTAVPFTANAAIASYGLYLGETEVTSENAADILGDGKASYDNSTKTLTLDNPVIPGKAKDASGYTAKIYSTLDELTIKGSYLMTASEAKYAVDAKQVIFDGNFSLYGSESGVYAYGIKFNGGRAYCWGKTGQGVQTTKVLGVYNGIQRVEFTSQFSSAVYYGKEFYKDYEVNVTTPANYSYGTHCILDGNNGNADATTVVLENPANGPKSGTTGDCTWEFDPGTGIMTISGSGAMADYDFDTSVFDSTTPWGAFMNDIVSVIIEDGVTNIGDYAFYSAENLKEVVISDSVETVGDDAFDSCDQLKNVTFGKNLNHIGSYAFAFCYVIEELEFPDSLEYIDVDAFVDCDQLKKVTFGKNVKTIDSDAFYDCDLLKSVTIPESVTEIGETAFGYYWASDDDPYHKIDKFRIYGQPDTAAQTYAEENGFTFVAFQAYDLWLGTTQVTSLNCDDILNDGGKAKFDPSTNTLTLNNPNISDYYTNRHGDTDVIYSESEIENLTITGRYNLGYYAAEYGIHNYSGSITLNGDFVLSGTECAVVSGYDDVTISGGDIYLYSDSYFCVACRNFIVTNNVKKLTINSNYNAIYASEGIQLGSELAITKPDGAYIEYDVIYDKNGEYAKEVVIEKGSAPARKIGDVNGDNNVDVLDAAIVQKYAAGKSTLTPEQIYAGDVNGDNNTDVLDAATIQKYAAGKITEFKKKS